MKSYSFKDKVVIVTGASSGIGKELSYKMAEKGCKVVISARSEEKLAEIEKDILESGHVAFACKADVSIEKDCRNLINSAINRFGKVDILVNNAGISMRSLFIDADIAVLRKVMDTNFWGTAYCTKYALPVILESHGSIVSISSVAGFHGLPGRSGYSASKFAIHGLMETIRIENLKNGLHVMIVAPGFTATEIRKNALLADGSKQGDSPMNEKMMMTPGKVAALIIRGISKKKRNLIIGPEGKLTAFFRPILPKVLDRAYYIELASENDSPLKQ